MNTKKLLHVSYVRIIKLEGRLYSIKTHSKQVLLNSKLFELMKLVDSRICDTSSFYTFVFYYIDIYMMHLLVRCVHPKTYIIPYIITRSLYRLSANKLSRFKMDICAYHGCKYIIN